MKEVTAPPEPELDVLWKKRPAPPQKPKKKDYRLLRSQITNLVLMGVICIMAVVIWVMQAGPM